MACVGTFQIKIPVQKKKKWSDVMTEICLLRVWWEVQLVAIETKLG